MIYLFNIYIFRQSPKLTVHAADSCFRKMLFHCDFTLNDTEFIIEESLSVQMHCWETEARPWGKMTQIKTVRQTSISGFCVCGLKKKILSTRNGDSVEGRVFLRIQNSCRQKGKLIDFGSQMFCTCARCRQILPLLLHLYSLSMK